MVASALNLVGLGVSGYESSAPIPHPASFQALQERGSLTQREILFCWIHGYLGSTVGRSYGVIVRAIDDRVDAVKVGGKGLWSKKQDVPSHV